MNIYKSLLIALKRYADIKSNRIIAIGNFDGVHIAHQEIVKKCLNISSYTNYEVLILTFLPHTASIVNKSSFGSLITSYEEKKVLLSSIGKVSIAEVPFTKDFANIAACDFIEKVLVNMLGASYIISGYNFRFGCNKDGDRKLLYDASKKYGFVYYSISQLYRDHHLVSSSNIRKFLKLGAVNIVSRLLGRRYAIACTVAHGEKRGRELGFKTANVILKQEMQYPLYGVYKVKVKIQDSYFDGIANIGVKPSYGLNGMPVLEVHLIDFDHDIYGSEIVVEFDDFIRPERTFGDLSELKEQIISDIKAVKQLLKIPSIK